MMDYQQDSSFFVCATQSDSERWKDLEAFRSFLEAQLQSLVKGMGFSGEVTKLTRMVDDEEGGLGDCFVAGIYFTPMVNDGDGSGLDQHVLSNVSGWLDPKSEVWVTASEPIPLAPPYGWKQAMFRCSCSSSEAICTSLKQYGLAIVQTNIDDNVDSKVTSPQFSGQSHKDDFYADVRSRLGEHIQLLEDTVRRLHPHIRLGESAFGFQEFTHRGPGRFELLLDPEINDLYSMLRETLEPQWIESVCDFLQQPSGRLRLNISCVYSRPGSTDQEWHTDGDHYDGGGSSQERPYAVCLFVPLIPLTQATGYTRFWPESHRYPNLLGLAQAADALKATVDGVDLQPGDYVMYDYTTWHKGIGNTTTDTERPILQFLYSCDWYKERKNYGTTSVFDSPK